MHPVIYLNKVMLEATKARVAPVVVGDVVWPRRLHHRGDLQRQALSVARALAPPEEITLRRLSVDRAGANERNVGEALENWSRSIR